MQVIIDVRTREEFVKQHIRDGQMDGFLGSKVLKADGISAIGDL